MRLKLKRRIGFKLRTLQKAFSRCIWRNLHIARSDVSRGPWRSRGHTRATGCRVIIGSRISFAVSKRGTRAASRRRTIRWGIRGINRSRCTVKVSVARAHVVAVGSRCKTRSIYPTRCPRIRVIGKGQQLRGATKRVSCGSITYAGCRSIGYICRCRTITKN